MKKYLFIILLLLTSICFGQTKVTGSIDFLNALKGSNPTNNKASLNYTISTRTSLFKEKILFYGSFEQFKVIEYLKYGFGVGKEFKERNLQYSFILEYTLTNRYNDKTYYKGYGVSNYIDYKIYDKMYFTIQFQTLKRTDIDKLYKEINSYRVSTFIGITYKF